MDDHLVLRELSTPATTTASGEVLHGHQQDTYVTHPHTLPQFQLKRICSETFISARIWSATTSPGPSSPPSFRPPLPPLSSSSLSYSTVPFSRLRVGLSMLITARVTAGTELSKYGSSYYSLRCSLWLSLICTMRTKAKCSVRETTGMAVTNTSIFK